MNESIKAKQIELAKTKSYLDIMDVSLISNLSLATIRRSVDEGKLKAIQNVPKGKLLFKKSSVEQWLEN